jgi:hypothetical protein
MEGGRYNGSAQQCRSSCRRGDNIEGRSSECSDLALQRPTLGLPDHSKIRYKSHRFWTPTVMSSGSVQRGSRAEAMAKAGPPVEAAAKTGSPTEAAAKAGLSAIRLCSDRCTCATSVQPDDGKTV